MPRIQYIEKNIRPETEALIRWADATARDYKRRGLDLTLRQLYYQGVSQNRFPNSEQSYKRLGNTVSDGRLLGLIDWSLLEDRTRNPGGTSWHRYELPSVEDLIERASYQRVHDWWRGQPRRVEVWVEKQALEQVAERAANRFRVPYLSCRGYMSQSEMWEAGYNRLAQYIEDGQEPLILHLGDHDPSGIDMTRDITERLEMFAESPIEVKRLALNYDQITTYNPPPNPAKMTDSRFGGYVREYGDESWELDALRPEVLIELIESEIQAVIDPDPWNDRQAEEREARAEVEEIAERWDEVSAYLRENPAK